MSQQLLERIELLEARSNDALKQAQRALDAAISNAEESGLGDALEPVLPLVQTAFKSLGSGETTQKQRSIAYRNLLYAGKAAKSEAQRIRGYAERQPMLDVLDAIEALHRVLLDMYEE